MLALDSSPKFLIPFDLFRVATTSFSMLAAISPVHVCVSLLGFLFMVVLDQREPLMRKGRNSFHFDFPHFTKRSKVEI